MTAPTAPKSLTSAEMLHEMFRCIRLDYRPQPFKVYKPQKGNGTALGVELRLDPEWRQSDRGTDYMKEVDGGLFVVLAPEEGVNDRGDPKFAWSDKARRVTVKFGLPDISAMLLGMREVRVRGKTVPDSIAPKRKNRDTNQWELTDPTKTTVGMTHKSADHTAIITYKFEAAGSHLSMSESKEKRRSIKLSLAEELQFQAYLEHAMHMFLKVGL